MAIRGGGAHRVVHARKRRDVKEAGKQQQPPVTNPDQATSVKIIGSTGGVPSDATGGGDPGENPGDVY